MTMPKKKEKTAPTCCNCGSALPVTKVCARRFVALCSKPCMKETIMCYGQSEDEVVENYTNTMKEQAGRRKRRSK